MEKLAQEKKITKQSLERKKQHPEATQKVSTLELANIRPDTAAEDRNKTFIEYSSCYCPSIKRGAKHSSYINNF